MLTTRMMQGNKIKGKRVVHLYIKIFSMTRFNRYSSNTSKSSNSAQENLTLNTNN